jgi:hypothetical protein
MSQLDPSNLIGRVDGRVTGIDRECAMAIANRLSSFHTTTLVATLFNWLLLHWIYAGAQCRFKAKGLKSTQMTFDSEKDEFRTMKYQNNDKDDACCRAT